MESIASADQFLAGPGPSARPRASWMLWLCQKSGIGLLREAKRHYKQKLTSRAGIFDVPNFRNWLGKGCFFTTIMFRTKARIEEVIDNISGYFMDLETTYYPEDKKKIRKSLNQMCETEMRLCLKLNIIFQKQIRVELGAKDGDRRVLTNYMLDEIDMRRQDPEAPWGVDRGGKIEGLRTTLATTGVDTTSIKVELGAKDGDRRVLTDYMVDEMDLGYNRRGLAQM
ncbi:hypothetical protein LAZ67_3002195, partial [Cordylochernes scorpioides]